jgi:CO/xanthine dehydrogenase FAD-binding subunit
VQVPAQVEYERATSVSHALALLARYGPEARILAGGHSLIPMMKLRLAQPEVLIDINGITDLRHITKSGGVLRIGTLARHADLLESALAGEHFAILHDAERVIADPIVREWGTVGGSLCQADPSEDLSAAFAALTGTMLITGPNGTREVAARQFHLGPYETVVGPAEMLTEIRLPISPKGATPLYSPGGATPLSTPRQRGEPPFHPLPGGTGTDRRPPGLGSSGLRSDPRQPAQNAGSRAGGLGTSAFGSAYIKVARRAGDWPVGAAGAAVWLGAVPLRAAASAAPLIEDVGIGLTALGARNFVAAEAEDFLRGRPATEENLRRTGEIAASHCRPVADQRGPEDYKRHLAGELTIRALRLAIARASDVGAGGARVVAGEQE